MKFDHGHQNLSEGEKINGGCHHAKFERSQLNNRWEKKQRYYILVFLAESQNASIIALKYTAQFKK